MRGAGGDADKAGPGAGAGILGVGVVDVAEEVDMSAALEPAVGVALVGKPAATERVVGEDEDDLAGAVRVREGGGEGGFAEVELAAVDVAGGEERGGEADEADGELPARTRGAPRLS